MPVTDFLPAEASVVLEGRVSIEAALAAGVRPVLEILATDPGDRRLAFLRRAAAAAEVPIHRVPAEQLRRQVSGTSHGGVIALAGERSYLSIDELLEQAIAPALLVMLDGIEDPYNYGQAIRSVYAAGADGLIVRQRSWEQAAGIVTRASAGASELLPTAVVESAAAAAEACREVGLRVACATTRSDAIWLHEADLTVPLLLLIGGERRGITRSFTEDADLLLRIPYGRRGAHALGAATSAALIAFEALRQRRAAGLGRPEMATED
ncbi:MAG: RNA methyltransferase [Chloroflexota bacterium]|nr:RNA methyltransferase [Chloroflexota bacterium]